MRSPEIVMNFASTKSPPDYGQSFEHPADEGMLYVPGGTYRMGSDRHYPEEAPVHRVSVAEFWIDRTPVTNRQFRNFINATGYVTFAEIAPDAKDYPGALPQMLKAGSLVFTPPKQAVDLRNWGQWWTFKFGANWRRPYGPRSNISGLDEHPVVHVAYRDVEAYARWAGKELPTEADWYSQKHEADAPKACCIPQNPRGGPEAASYGSCRPDHRIPRKVLKGGSHLCAPNYCRRYRPAARHAEPIDTSASHVGFRCISRKRITS